MPVAARVEAHGAERGNAARCKSSRGLRPTPPGSSPLPPSSRPSPSLAPFPLHPRLPPQALPWQLSEAYQAALRDRANSLLALTGIGDPTGRGK